ncbi:MAG: class I SAM-dependent methyltransferase [Deltaproteobacteria bacterium]|nr:class I SAM-dependent methyltransferase [Deltaproteobacteria bacterium]
MKLVRLGDLSAAFQPDGAILVRSASHGVSARVPPPVVSLMAFCTTPKAESEVASLFGPSKVSAFRQLAEIGILVTEEQAADTPVFFENYADVDVHRRMLADRPRVNAFKAAIQAVVKPGMVVMDCGTGNGILALLAAQAGARKVYAVDRSALLDTAKEVARASGYGDVIQFVRGDFARVELPEKVDVIVSETIGQFAVAEGGGPDLAQAMLKNLKPGGAIVPNGVELHVAPVGDPTLYNETVDPFDGRDGFDQTILREASLRRGRTTEVDPTHLLAPGQRVTRFDWPIPEIPGGEASWTFAEGGVVRGLAGWFVLDMAPGLQLPSGPSDPLTHWKQIYFPIKPIELAPGDSLNVHMDVEPATDDRRGIRVSWEIEVHGETRRLEHRVR